MRSAVRSRAAGAADDDTADRRNPRPFVLAALGWSNRDAAGFAFGVMATIAVLINGLWMQSGQHPAPMLKTGLIPAPPPAPKETTVGALAKPRANAADAAAAPGAAAKPPAKSDPQPAPRTSTDVLSDIQRELARRGFYEDAVDGRFGSKTEAAIRNFERTAGVKASTEPNEALLHAIAHSNAKAGKPAAAPLSGAPRPAIAPPPAAAPRATAGAPQSLRPPAPIPGVPRNLVPPAPIPNAPARSEASAEPAAGKRVAAVQRALADYGYGQIKPTGVVDAPTQAAIAKFERERKLPVTGQPSERVAHELASITGRALD